MVKLKSCCEGLRTERLLVAFRYLRGNEGGAILARDLPPDQTCLCLPRIGKTHFDKRFRNREEVQEAYDRAHRLRAGVWCW